jgi:hypothetical protein
MKDKLMTHVRHDPSMSTMDLANCVTGFAMSDDCVGDNAVDLMEQTVGRLLVLRDRVMFMSAGLIVTNLVWIGHALEWY